MLESQKLQIQNLHYRNFKSRTPYPEPSTTEYSISRIPKSRTSIHRNFQIQKLSNLEDSNPEPSIQKLPNPETIQNKIREVKKLETSKQSQEWDYFYQTPNFQKSPEND